MLLPAGVMDETEHRPAVTEVDYIRSCKYSQVLLMMGENNAETCRSDWVQIHKPKSFILLVINYELDFFLLNTSNSFSLTYKNPSSMC